MERLRILLPISASELSSVAQNCSYTKLVEQEFEPVVVSPRLTKEELADAVAISEGLLIPGGVDVSPRSYHHKSHPKLGNTDHALDEMQLSLLTTIPNEMPIFGICRGAQILTVAEGGTLYQHIPIPFAGEKHGVSIEVKGQSSFHEVFLSEGSKVSRAIGTTYLTDMVSRHHQAVNNPGRLIISGLSPAGVTESVEDPSHPFKIGVQWHPDFLQRNDINTHLMHKLYSSFGQAVEIFRMEKNTSKRAS